MNQPAKTAADFSPKPIEWLWEEDGEGIIPKGMLTVVAGKPGKGKSLFTVELAARVSRDHGAVIFGNMEDSRSYTLRPRFDVADAHLPNVHFFSPTLPRDTAMLDTMIGALGAKLVVLDPVSAHLTCSIYNDQDVRQALSPLAEMAEAHNCAIVLVTHTTKGIKKSSHPLDVIGGAGGGLPGAARVVYLFGPNPEDESERILATAKSNIHRGTNVAFQMDEVEYEAADEKTGVLQSIKTGRLLFLAAGVKCNAVEVVRDSEAGATSDGIPTEKKAQAAEWLTAYLSLGEQPVKALREDAAQQGISWMTLRRAADDIGIIKARHGFGQGSYVVWYLPDGHPALVAAAAQVTVDEAIEAATEDGDTVDTSDEALAAWIEGDDVAADADSLDTDDAGAEDAS